MRKPELPRTEPAIRLVIRWDPRRKVWAIVGSYGSQVVCETAETRVEVDRADLVRLVAALRFELESWLPLPIPFDQMRPKSQADTPRVEAGMMRATALAELGEREASAGE